MLSSNFLAIFFGLCSTQHFFVAYTNQDINLKWFCLTEFEVICIKTM